MRFRAFIFDVGNVLLRWSPPEIVRAALPAAADAERYRRGIFAHPLWAALDAGEIDEPDAIRQFATNLGCDEAEVARIIRAAQDSLVPLPTGMSLLAEVDQPARDLVCLTNMSRETFAHIRPRYDFWTRFKGIVVSGQVRMAKPNPAIYRHTLDAHGLEAESTVFIDDHPANVEAARALGITAVEYDGSARCAAQVRALAVQA